MVPGRLQGSLQNQALWCYFQMSYITHFVEYVLHGVAITWARSVDQDVYRYMAPLGVNELSDQHVHLNSIG